ncbi:RnfABCDGE type electron transport complex subunit G [Pseudomonas vanderleydeniana]|uniref:Ion-translocating oxidoreductase complex subunit G n=1 Tax=Pseudomonas vanderleydeniana TaxID=2745495 RepID=A0A9E6PJT9_9PSED|nr:RnfABCDGE type electron transport complex subunit G [Pseudomonas vanderleydeniana]QXI27481.1 RnfABCDGE type electron transport complex subunit G [Pseudomonas vanderleydeniana]
MSRTGSILALAALAALIGGLSWELQQQAAPRILAQQQAIETRTLAQVLPAGEYQRQSLALSATELPHGSLVQGYRMLRPGQPAAIILQSRTRGYGGPLELLIGIGANGRLLGVKTLSHQETSGLGARIAEEHGWLSVFFGKSRTDTPDTAWHVKKDGGQFDQMAGATITSRAAVDAIHDALRYFDEHREQLLGEPEHE